MKKNKNQRKKYTRPGRRVGRRNTTDRKKASGRAANSRENVVRSRPSGRGRASLRGGEELTGRFCGTRYGYGFLLREGSGDLFLPAPTCRGIYDGDTVRVRLLQRGERAEGRIEELLTPGRTHAVGCAVFGESVDGELRGEVVFLPDDSHIPPLLLSRRDRGLCGRKLLVMLPRDGEIAQVEQDFGPADTRQANYAAILREFGVETDFSEDEYREAEAAAREKVGLEGREDLRRRIIFTIDGEGAKDLDDAISLRKTRDGYLLGVHIADVSHYVRPFGALDAVAHRRGTSLYFADRVVPMLPPDLSNGACSLNAGEDKYAMSAEILLDGQGEIRKTRIFRSVIRSCVRGVYREVNRVFESGEEADCFAKYSKVYKNLQNMRELYKILASRASERGVLDLETPEAVIALDEEGNPLSIRREERGEAERMIEAFMLAANRAVAELLTERQIPLVYRVHAAPPPEKIASFTAFLRALRIGVPWRPGQTVTLPMLSAVLGEAREKGKGEAVSLMMLRSLSKAEYSATPTGHFALSLPLYCHFTSPIRRLSDLVTHRIIGAVLLGKSAPGKYRSSAHRAATAATAGELRAIGAERRIEALFKAQYMLAHIGEIFPARITSVTSFGFYAETADTCEGLVPLSLLPEGFAYEEDSRTLRRAETVYEIGMPVLIRVRDADIATARVTFEPVEAEMPPREEPKPGEGRPARGSSAGEKSRGRSAGSKKTPRSESRSAGGNRKNATPARGAASAGGNRGGGSPRRKKKD